MATDIIEGTAVEVDEPRALVVVSDTGMTATGPLALAALSDDEFERRLAALDTMRTRVARMQKALMRLDVDYGVIPGTGTKPTLLKPGAEKLCQAYGLAADFLPKRTTGDGLTVPHLSYVTRCELHLGSLDGLVIAVGYGAANSWERKHRYRRGERLCPDCGKPTIIKGRDEYGGGWLCFAKKGGCGHKWPDGAAEIEGQTVGDIENPDPFDLDVVLAKMSEKRAFIDATLRATAASGLFTQDIEDLGRSEQDAPGHEEPPKPEQTDDERVELLGNISKSGKVEKGTSDGYKLDWHETPDGHTIGFRVKLDGDDRAIPQVRVLGAIGEALFLFTGGDPKALLRVRISFKGKLYNVRQAPPRQSYYRLVIGEGPSDFIETPEVRIPALGPDPVAVAVEAASVPLFTDEEAAAIVAAEYAEATS